MRNTCRLSNKELVKVVDFGDLYVSNFSKDITPDALKAPLTLGLGQESGLLQLFDTVNPDNLYTQYWYKSGTNETMKKQLKEIVNVVPNWVKLNNKDIVLDIGCNDGTLLSHYASIADVIRVGIDPARNIADIGKLHCNLHTTDYFTKEIFFNLTNGRKAKIITSIAMFYDLEDPHTFVEDISQSLTDDGIWIIQLSYTPLMFNQNAFDNICHEHIEYYTLSSLNYLIEAHDLKIIDVELNDTNSGSFRLVISRKNNKLNNVNIFYRDIGEYRYKSLLAYENTLHLDEPKIYLDFKNRIEKLKQKTLDLLLSLKKQGKTVFGYGASTKGNTLLQYYGIGPDLIQCIAERQPQKYGYLTVGSWIPIISEGEMRKSNPDYLFILPWHFINEFKLRESDFLQAGGKFIVPLPELMIIE